MFSQREILDFHDEAFEKSDFLENLADMGKAAILCVHFGTTYEDTRKLTIDAINKKIADKFPNIASYEAYTSRIIIRRLKERGIIKLNPNEMLRELADKGITNVIVIPTNIINGIEMESLERDVLSLSHLFNEIRVAKPLLYSSVDYKEVANALMKELQYIEGQIILVGHGTYHPANASYPMLDYILKLGGGSRFHIATIEGFPGLDEAIAHFPKDCRELTLVPFMFVAGDHARNDIAGDWKEDLEDRGYKVDVLMKGLGEYPSIQDIILSRVSFSINHKKIDIMSKKKKYAVDKD